MLQVRKHTTGINELLPLFKKHDIIDCYNKIKGYIEIYDEEKYENQFWDNKVIRLILKIINNNREYISDDLFPGSEMDCNLYKIIKNLRNDGCASRFKVQTLYECFYNKYLSDKFNVQYVNNENISFIRYHLIKK